MKNLIFYSTIIFTSLSSFCSAEKATLNHIKSFLKSQCIELEIDIQNCKDGYESELDIYRYYYLMGNLDQCEMLLRIIGD